MINLAITILKTLCYTGAFLGLWMVLRPIVIPGIKRNINISKSKQFSGSKKKNRFIRHLEMVTGVATDNKINTSTFLIISIGLLLISFILLNQVAINPGLKFIISLSSAVTPYLILRVLLNSVRVNASWEGEALITEIINQYKINYFNIIEAIDVSMKYLKKQPYSHSALFRLSVALRQYKNTDELEDAIENFTYSIDTQWVALLANNIYISIEYGVNVVQSLEDILNDIKDIKKIIEKNKQLNHEAFFMTRFIAPVAYIFSIFGSIKYFGFTFKKFLEYQFSDMGIKCFAIVVITAILNYAIYLKERKPKYDF